MNLALLDLPSLASTILLISSAVEYGIQVSIRFYKDSSEIHDLYANKERLVMQDQEQVTIDMRVSAVSDIDQTDPGTV